MQTSFSPERLADPDIAEANAILRSCVHCGFCIATCPTYVLLGDELDSPRGRIYLIKQMLEDDRPASAKVALHIDRCLSCLSCMTTCPSGVNYMRLVDQARAHIERTFRRPLLDRTMRDVLAFVLPRPRLFALAAMLCGLARPIARLLPGRLRSMAGLARAPGGFRRTAPGTRPADGPRAKRVALLAGCVQDTLAPSINEATIRLLRRHGCEVVVAADAGCCGALVHHLGKSAHGQVMRNVEAWHGEIETGGLDAIVVNASGCGTMVKDYGHILRNDPTMAEKAARVSALARDVSEILTEIGLGPAAAPGGLTVAYHAACSLQHGQKVRSQPKRLLEDAGFTVVEPKEAHLCCGSAGSYNLLQPLIAGRLGERKAGALADTGAAVVATGNIGCKVQIERYMDRPVVHVAELLDWATGGPRPDALGHLTDT